MRVFLLGAVVVVGVQSIGCKNVDDDAGGSSGTVSGIVDGETGGGAPASTSPGVGTITVFQNRKLSSATAAYYPTGAQGPCSATLDGSCTYLTCPALPEGVKQISVGNIVVEGGKKSTTLRFEGGAYKAFQGAPGDLFTAETMLLFDSPNGGLSANLSLPGAGEVIVTSFDVAAPPTIDRTKDFAFGWTGGKAGEEVQVQLTDASSTSTDSVSCYAPAGDGKLSLPAMLLGMLPAGGSTLTIQNGESESITSATGWATTLVVAQAAYDTKGTEVSTTVQLQ